MADPFGIAGLTGTAEQLVRLTKGIIDSHKALKENKPAAERLLSTYEELQFNLNGLSLDSFRGAKPSHVEAVRRELEQAQKTITDARDEAERICDSSKNWISKYPSALSDKAGIEKLSADAEKIRECIFTLSSDENLMWLLNNPGGDFFSRTVWAQKNPTSVSIDLNATGEDGQANTCESKLKEAVFRDGPEMHVGAIAIGQGGVGKTCALRAIANDPDVEKRFPGGAYFLSLGKDASIGTIIQQLCVAVKASGGLNQASKLQTDENLESVVAGVQSWFKEQVCLFIFDDVWTTNCVDAKVLQTLSGLVSNVSGDGTGKSRILYSTRDRQLHRYGREVYFKPRDRQGDRSVSILLHVAGADSSEWDDSECKGYLQAILDKCDGLPLALNVAGSAVRFMRDHWEGEAKEAWKKYAKMMNDPDRFERQYPGDMYSSLDAMFQSSLEVLDGSKEEKEGFSMGFREMHRSLCVLKKQDWLPLPILQHIWGAVNEHTAERGLIRLQSVGLAELSYQGGSAGVRLHDLTQDFARREANEHNETGKWHRKLLDKYFTDDGSLAQSFLFSVDEDEKKYVFENVYRVCREAGRYEEMHRLLQSSRWVSSVLQNGTFWQLEQAVRDCTDEVMGSNAAVGETEPRLDEDCNFAMRMIAKAARLSVSHLDGCVSGLFFQLYARLLEVSGKSPSLMKFLEDIEKWTPTPWLKPTKPCLVGADGAVLEDISIGVGISEDIELDEVKFSSDGVFGCGRTAASELYAFKQKRGEQVDQMRWRVDTPSDAVLRRELGGASASLMTREAEVETEQRGKKRTVKRFLQHLRATVKCYGWRGRPGGGDQSLSGNEDERKEITPRCSAVCEDFVAAGYSDGTIQMRRFSTDKIERIIRAHGETVSSISFRADGRWVVSGSDDTTVRVWNVATGAPVCEALTGHTNRVNSVAISEDGARVVSGSEDNTVRVWDVATGAPVCEALTRHKWEVIRVAMSGDGARVVLGSHDTMVRVWDVATGVPVGEALTGHTHYVDSVAISRDGARVVSGSRDNTARVWDVGTGTPVGDALKGHENWVTNVTVSQNGARVVSCSEKDKTVRVWDVARGTPAGEALKRHTERVSSIAISGDGARVVSGSWDNTVRVWDVATGTPVGEALKGHTNEVSSVAISGDGALVVSGAEDDTVLVWDVATGTPVGEALTGHTKEVSSVAMSEDGKLVVSGSKDDTVRVWEVATGECLLVTEMCKWNETVTQYCGSTEEHSEAATPKEEADEDYYKDNNSVLLRRGNGAEETLARFETTIFSFQVDRRKGIVTAGLRSGIVAILRIVKS